MSFSIGYLKKNIKYKTIFKGTTVILDLRFFRLRFRLGRGLRHDGPLSVQGACHAVSISVRSDLCAYRAH